MGKPAAAPAAEPKLTLHQVSGPRAPRAAVTFVFADASEVSMAIATKKGDTVIQTFRDEGGRTPARGYMARLLVKA